jgi:hypothetical protein
MGVTARGFTADITNSDQLVQAIQSIQEAFGFINVLECSPHSGNMELIPQPKQQLKLLITL